MKRDVVRMKEKRLSKGGYVFDSPNSLKDYVNIFEKFVVNVVFLKMGRKRTLSINLDK